MILHYFGQVHPRRAGARLNGRYAGAVPGGIGFRWRDSGKAAAQRFSAFEEDE